MLLYSVMMMTDIYDNTTAFGIPQALMTLQVFLWFFAMTLPSLVATWVVLRDEKRYGVVSRARTAVFASILPFRRQVETPAAASDRTAVKKQTGKRAA